MLELPLEDLVLVFKAGHLVFNASEPAIGNATPSFLGIHSFARSDVRLCLDIDWAGDGRRKGVIFGQRYADNGDYADYNEERDGQSELLAFGKRGRITH